MHTSAEYSELDKFRSARRKSEYTILIDNLPDVLCLIVLDYAQFDDDILTRIKELYAHIFGVGIWVRRRYLAPGCCVGVYVSGSDNILYIHTISVCDIFESCYCDNSRLIYLLIDWIRPVSESPTPDTDITLSLIDRMVIRGICWPEYNSESEEYAP